MCDSWPGLGDSVWLGTDTLCSALGPATGSEGDLFSGTSLVGHWSSGRLGPWLWDLLFFQLLNAILDLDC